MVTGWIELSEEDSFPLGWREEDDDEYKRGKWEDRTTDEG